MNGKIRINRSSIGIAMLLMMLAGNSSPVSGQEGVFFDLSIEELGSIRVTDIATGTKTPLDKAAAIVSVITDEDIEAMGATDINHVLETIPGLHIGVNNQGFGPKFNIRGITSSFNPHTLILINGTPITSLFNGNRNNAWGGMPVKSIKKIEVIRGPGSALYGADAFAGVIDIQTKKRKDIDSNSVGARIGSFDESGGWIQYGAKYSDFDIGLTAEYQATDGWDGEISTGVLNTGVESLDFHSQVENGNWTWSTMYQARRNIELGVGLAPVLDPRGAYDSDRLLIDTKYLFDDVADGLDLAANVSYYYNTQEVASSPHLLPPGAVPGFPDGVIGTPEYREEQIRIDFSSTYGKIDDHIIRAGIGLFWGDIFETKERKNFDPFSLPALVPRAGGLAETEDTDEVFLPEKDRKSRYAFIQDEWLFADNWSLTTGVRYDHYSDFGDTANPRVALVWATTDTITTKLLYGRAFRAPSFVELFVTSNPVVLGNPDLRPEIINSYEFAFSHQVSSQIRYSANIFYYDIDDFIVFSGIPGELAQNSGERKGKGVELEVEYSRDNMRLIGNYAFQKSTDGDTFESSGESPNQAVGEAPNHQIYLRSEWRTNDRWFISTQVNWVGKQLRSAVDDRDSVPHYTTVDLSIKQKDVAKDFDVSLTFRNLFDREVYEPSELNRIQENYPMPGRNLVAEFSYTF